jgi:hypothetical protein
LAVQIPVPMTNGSGCLSGPVLGPVPGWTGWTGRSGPVFKTLVCTNFCCLKNGFNFFLIGLHYI